MQNLLLYSIIIPIVLGIFCMCMSKIKKIKEVLALIGSLFFLFIAVQVYFNKPVEWIVREITILKIDNLSAFLLLAVSVFAVINIIYSIKFMEGKGRQGLYYGSILWTLGATCGVLMSNHLILFLLFWGVLGITLYLLILSHLILL